MYKRFFYCIFLFITACGGAGAPEQTDDIQTVTSNSIITWTAPQSYTDNTTLYESDIGGYHIYVSLDKANFELNSTISSAEDASFSLSKLGKGIRHIVITCFDVNGIESDFSEIITVKII